MFLKEKKDGHLVEILSLGDLFNPTVTTVVGRLHYGDEMGEPDKFPKAELIFPSGEALPRYWLDIHYRDMELRK